MEISFQSDIEQVAQRFSADLRKEIDKAVPTALNRVATTVRKVAAQQINKVTGLKVTSIRKRLRLRKATRARPIAEITALPYAPNLRSFNARQVKKGVSANAWRKRKIYRGAFIGNQDRTVFIRVGYTPPAKRGRGRRGTSANRTIGLHQRRAHQRTRAGKSFGVQAHSVGSGSLKPKARLKALFGPSVPKTFMQETVNRFIIETARSRWKTEFENQVRFRMSKI
jgi:hypothetical protein